MKISAKILLFTATIVVLLCYTSDGCRRLGREQLMAALRKRGKGPLGGFNKNYMAFTLKEARAFPNLGNLFRPFRPIKPFQAKSSSASSIVRRSERSMFPITTRRGPCVTTANGFRRSCPACPAFTDLGPDVVPRFINEVVCPNSFLLCASGGGVCKNTVLLQTFLRRKCDNGDALEKLEEFTQEIRACCECCLFG